MSGEATAPLSARQQEVTKRLEQCQTCALEASQESLGKALQSLHRALLDLRMPSSPKRESRLEEEKNDTSLLIEELEPPAVAASDSTTPFLTENAPSEQEFLHNVAKELINNLDRVIFSVDEEVNAGRSLYGFNYESDCKWYNDTMEEVARVQEGSNTNGDIRKGTDLLTSYCDTSVDVICDNSERWIDKCLDICGYAISLEVAVYCLRRIVHDSSTSSSDLAISPNKHAIERGDKRPGFAAAITSLRTVRRRLLHLPPPKWDGEERNLMAFPETYHNSLLRLKGIIDVNRINHLCEYIVLPLEYQHHNQQTHEQHHVITPAQQNMNNIQNDQLLSESLPSLAVSVLPTLVSSACYAMDLPLPSWATPKMSCGNMFHSAWKTLLAGELLDRCFTTLLEQDFSDSSDAAASSATDANSSNENLARHSSSMKTITSNHFQLLVRQMIEGGRSDIVIHHLYKCWKSCDTGDIGDSPTPQRDLNTPRSILCREFQSILASIPSKREVAMFSRTMLRHCAKQEMPISVANRFLSQQARDKSDEVRTKSILPFLREVLLPSISNDEGLADAMVNFIILTTSYHRQPQSSSQSYPTLHDVDRAVPRCLGQLLALVCADTTQYNEATCQEDSDSDDSQADSHHNFKAANGFLSHLFAVAAVWCEDIFVTRTDSLQQQYVTEFLLHPLESKQLTQDDLQQGLSDDGIPLATILVQGVTLRLDVSRPESIRIDGMRVAEAMATLLGQTLRFDELHPPGNDDAGIVEEDGTKETNKKIERRRRRKKKRAPVEPRAMVVVDPDAEYFTDDSESSDSSSQSDSSTSSLESDGSYDSNSSWGEDSLQPYSLNDDEEDLRRVPRPRTLRDCLAYLIISENDDLAYDKHHAALTELPTIISAQPLDLLDVVSTLVRVLLFLEDKFGIDNFLVKRWDSLMALGVQAPLETCIILVGEMRGNISLGTRMEALTLIKGMSQELSGMNSGLQQKAISSDQEVTSCSTKLRLALKLHDTPNKEEENTSLSKTRRWRKLRAPTTTTTNRFGPISVQMIYSLFALLSQTKTDASIWGGPIGERFLSEFLKTLSIMLYCARTYPSPALRVLATDLFDLAWSFHDAKCSEVRHAALLAMSTCMSLVPLEFVMNNAQGMSSYLNHCSALDEDAKCRQLASMILDNMSEVMSQNLIQGA